MIRTEVGSLFLRISALFIQVNYNNYYDIIVHFYGIHKFIL